VRWVDLTMKYTGSMHFALNLEPLDQTIVPVSDQLRAYH
jgi:hypothetical protein